MRVAGFHRCARTKAAARSASRTKTSPSGKTRPARANAAIVNPFQAVSTLSSRCGRGRAARKDAAACLLFSSENAVQVALEAIQALGGNGYINEFPAGRLLRDAKLYDIGAGTNEIRRMLIGRELFEESV